MTEHRKKICSIISEMLDNPDECGIYPTGKCFDQLEEYIILVERKAGEAEFNEILRQLIGGSWKVMSHSITPAVGNIEDAAAKKMLDKCIKVIANYWIECENINEDFGGIVDTITNKLIEKLRSIQTTNRGNQ